MNIYLICLYSNFINFRDLKVIFLVLKRRGGVGGSYGVQTWPVADLTLRFLTTTVPYWAVTSCRNLAPQYFRFNLILPIRIEILLLGAFSAFSQQNSNPRPLSTHSNMHVPCNCLRWPWVIYSRDVTPDCLFDIRDLPWHLVSNAIP